MLRRTLLALSSLSATTACIPYTVGTTAQPARVGERTSTLSTFVMPSFGRLDSTRSFSNIAVDFENRWGLDPRSDIGIRVPSGSGVIVNYKRLISDPAARTKVAIMPGAGFVNLGQHAHFELTLLASGYDPPRVNGARDTTIRPLFVPYGGLRVMQVAPLAQGAVSDRPTAGGFVGVRIGSADFGVSPELGVFYDHSALGVRRGDLVIVPAVSVHGDRLIQMMRGVFRGHGSILTLTTARRRREAAPPIPITPATQPPATLSRDPGVQPRNGTKDSGSGIGAGARRVSPGGPRPVRRLQLRADSTSR